MRKALASRRARFATVTLLVVAALGVGVLLRRGSDETGDSARGAASGTATSPSSAPARADRASSPGLRRTYATRFEEDVTLTTGRGREGDAAVRIRVKADLDLAFVAHDGDRHRLFAQLDHVELEAGAPSAKEKAALVAELTRPFWITAERDGRVRGYTFARDLSPTAQNLLRGLAASAQIAARDDGAADSWTVDEDDLQGAYRARYTKDASGALLKEKLPYTAASEGEGTARLETRGKGTSTVGDDGWPTRVSFEEHDVASMGENMPVATTDLRVEMTLKGTRVDLALLGLYERELDGLVVVGPHGTVDERESARIADRRLAGGASADAIVAEVRAAGDDAAAIAAGDKLAARLRLEPDDAAHVGGLARTLPARDANVLVGALGGAATRASTKALSDIVLDKKATPVVRANAATQLAFARGDLAADARDTLGQSLSDPSREVRDSSALALGNVARELGDGDGDSVPELIRRYASATTDEERALYLQALGNSGSVEVLTVARTALESESEMVREAAAQALRFLPVGEADVLLGRVLVAEPSSTVVLAAVDAIGFRIVEMHAEALGRAIEADTAGRVRASVAEIAQRALARRKGTLSAEGRAVLERLLAKATAGTN